MAAWANLSRRRPCEKRRHYYNFFQPVMRLAEKRFLFLRELLPVEGGGSHLRRTCLGSA